MHVLFIHQSFPAQFGQLAARLVADKGWRCTFLCRGEPGAEAGITKIPYEPAGETTRERVHPLARGFDGHMRNALGIYQALRQRRADLRPDVIVAHAVLGSTLFASHVFGDVPTINYFEDFYTPNRGAVHFRSDWPMRDEDALGAHAEDALPLLALEFCDSGYTPTHFQHGLLPAVYREKVRVLHDGIDTDFWRRPEVAPAKEGLASPRIVTYASRYFEPLRGFDIFLRAAKLIYEEFPDVIFLVAGSDEPGYGGRPDVLGAKTFREHLLAQDEYDVSRFRFLGWLRTEALLQVLSISDLHIYLTAPMVLSWSLLEAMSCECTVLASDTEPVREVIADGQNGLLRGFFDIEGLAATAVDVLRNPRSYRDLGRRARETVLDRYSLNAVLPRMARFYERVATGVD